MKKLTFVLALMLTSVTTFAMSIGEETGHDQEHQHVTHEKAHHLHEETHHKPHDHKAHHPDHEEVKSKTTKKK